MTTIVTWWIKNTQNMERWKQIHIN